MCKAVESSLSVSLSTRGLFFSRGDGSPFAGRGGTLFKNLPFKLLLQFTGISPRFSGSLLLSVLAPVPIPHLRINTFSEQT